MKRHFYLLTILLAWSPLIFAQHYGPERLSDQIHRQKVRSVIEAVTMFEGIKNTRFAKNNSNQFRLDPQKLERITLDRPNYWKTNLPIGNRLTEVELIPVRVVADDFVVSIGNKPSDDIQLDAGLRYIGKVSGQPQSQVIVSIRNGILTGDMQTDQGSFTLYHNPSDETNTYRCSPTINQSNKSLSCYSEDDGVPYTAKQLTSTNARVAATALEDLVIRVYVEIDKPRVFSHVAEDVAAFVNKTLDSIAKNLVIPLHNEGINIEVSEMRLWLYETPYVTQMSGKAKEVLGQFKNMMKEGFNGDLAMLYTQGKGGVAAGVAGLCNPDFSLRTTVCTSFSSMAHEIGHLLGSRHTHDCVWNGNATAIDGCDPSIGPCAQGPIPAPGKGTIMSYCHQVDSVGKEFGNGFGEQPGNVIRNNVLGAYCLSHRDEEPGTYCESRGLGTKHPLNSQNEAYIEKIEVGNYTNTSGDNSGYGDFTNDVVSLRAGTTVPVSITINKGRPEFIKLDSTTLGATLVSMWIDLDGDFDFSEPFELVFSHSNSTAAVFSGNITIPVYAKEGSHRMRIMFNMDYSNPLVPCEIFELGEVEDYTIQILPQIDPGVCGIPQVISSTTLSPNQVEIKVSPIPNASSYSVRYFGAPKGLNLAGMVTSSSTSILLNGLRPGTRYNYEVRANCNNSSSSAFSDDDADYFFTNTCSPPKPSYTVPTTRAIDVDWVEDPTQPVWEIRFRPLGGDTWIKVWNPTPPVRLNALDENTNYEFQLGSSCSSQDSVNLFYGELVPFKAGDQWEVVMHVRDQWPNGVTVDVTVNNIGKDDVNEWDVEFSLDNANIYYSWATILSGNGQPYVFSNMPYNNNIPAGGSATFGFNASKSGSFMQPRSATVNGFPARLVVSGKVDPLYQIEVMARGTTGTESIDVTVGGRKVTTYKPATIYLSHRFWTAEQGGINVYFTNDAPERDVQLNYIIVDGNQLEAEHQTVNTAAWDGVCGGGTLTEWMHCNGYIGFLGYDPNARKSLDLSPSEEAEKTISLFPNPAGNILSVALGKSEPTVLSFYSVTGDLVHRETIKQSAEIDISKLKAGLYVVRMEAKDRYIIQKLIKK